MKRWEKTGREHSNGVDFETLLTHYRGKIVSEWVVSKIIRILDENEGFYIKRSRGDEQRKILFIVLFCEKT